VNEMKIIIYFILIEVLPLLLGWQVWRT